MATSCVGKAKASCLLCDTRGWKSVWHSLTSGLAACDFSLSVQSPFNWDTYHVPAFRVPFPSGPGVYDMIASKMPLFSKEVKTYDSFDNK